MILGQNPKPKSIDTTYHHHFIMDTASQTKRAHHNNFNVTTKDFMTSLKEVACAFKAMTRKVN
jgi:hypothetical protein